MTAISNCDTETLLKMAGDGNAKAATELFQRNRDRLRKMVAIRLDRRLRSRVDPSDVVQETLAEATKQLDQFIREQPLPFYPWLRQLAWTRVQQLHRFHLQAQRRSVTREVDVVPTAQDGSVAELTRHFIAIVESPSAAAVRQERKHQVQSAVETLPEIDREVLVLRYVEHLSTNEAASVMEISPNTFAQRHVRAIKRLRDLMPAESEGSADE